MHRNIADSDSSNYQESFKLLLIRKFFIQSLSSKFNKVKKSGSIIEGSYEENKKDENENK